MNIFTCKQYYVIVNTLLQDLEIFETACGSHDEVAPVEVDEQTESDM